MSGAKCFLEVYAPSGWRIAAEVGCDGAAGHGEHRQCFERREGFDSFDAWASRSSRTYPLRFNHFMVRSTTRLTSASSASRVGAGDAKNTTPSPRLTYTPSR